MNRLKKSLLGKFVRDERGQSIAVVIVTLAAVMALSAAGVESGHVYYAYRLLQASTRSATLAGAQAMPNILEASTYVTQYSSESNQLNYTNLLQNDSISANYYCSSKATSLNVGCQAPLTGEGSCTTGSTCNAVSVTQTAQVKLWFGGLIGMSKMNLSDTETAAMRGGTNIPYNIAVILDTTGSMGSTKAPSSDGCGSNAYQINCAVTGLATMLEQMDPCQLNTTCTSSTAYVDGVALFVFPALNNAASNISKDTTCPTSNPTTVPYAFINVTPGTTQDLSLPTSATLYPNNSGTYEVVSFEDTYRANDVTTTPLTAGDALVNTVGVGTSGCKGLQAPGGESTYYAQVIRMAQATLVAQQASYPGSKNIMIILSDGDATACNSGANTAAGGCNSADNLVALNCPGLTSKGVCTSSKYTSCPSSGCVGTPLNGTGTATTNATGYQLATYPSALGECGQAVEAAQLATSAGTTVYTVAMGSPTSGGCASDAHYTISAGSTNGAQAWPSGTYSGQPCNAIAAMASNINTFYSDATAGCVALSSTNGSYTTIGGIFKAVADGLTAARLIPPGS